VKHLRASIPQRALIWAPLLCLATACTQSAPSIRYKTSGDMPVTADGLHRIESVRVGAVYLKPGARFAGYDAILVDPVTVSYKSPPQRASASNRSRGNFALSESQMDRLKRSFQEAFEQELEKSEAFQLVTEPGPTALRVSGHIVDLVVDAPPQRGSDRSFIMSAGEMTLILEVRDSLTREPLARLADRRAIRPTQAGAGRVYYSNPARNWAEVRNRMQHWATLLREGLDHLKQLPEVPEP
jgi:hypothetical protein